MHGDTADGEWNRYWDDLTGKELDKDMAKAAREAQRSAIRRMGIYRKVPREMCIRETGGGPVGTRWVDANKGDDQNPNVRCRLVAQDVKTSSKPGLFCAIPLHIMYGTWLRGVQVRG